MRLTSYTNFAVRVFMAVLDDRALADVAANRGDLLARRAPLEQGIVAPVRCVR